MICFWFPGCPLKRKFNYENLTNLNIFKFDGFSINDLTMSSNCHVHHAEGFRNKKFKLVHLIPNQRYVSSKNISFQGNHDIRRMYDLLRTSFWIVIKKFLLIHFLTVATSKNQDSRSKLSCEEIWRPPWKSGLTSKTTKARVVLYAIIQSPQWFSYLTFLGGLQIWDQNHLKHHTFFLR